MMKILQITIIFILLSITHTAPAAIRNVAECDSAIKRGITAVFDEKDYAKGLEILEEAKNTAEQKHWYKQLFLALNNLGILYHSTFNYGEALNYYLEAYTVVLKHLGNQETMTVLNNIAILYSKEKNYPKAMEYFLQAKELAEEAPIEKERIAMYNMNLGVTSNRMENPQMARMYLNEAEKYLTEDSELLPKVQIALLETDFLEHNYNKVIDNGLALLQSDAAKRDPIIANATQYAIARAYFKIKELPHSLSHAKEALHCTNNIEYKADTYDLLSEISYAMHSYREALSYKDSAFLMRDSLNRIKNGQLFENSKIRFELQDSRYKLSLKETELANQRKIFITVAASVVFIFLILGWLLRIRNTKRRQEKEIEQNRHKITELELQQAKKEIEMRNSQLQAKALSIASRNQLLNDIISSLSEHPVLSSDDNFIKQVHSLKAQINSESDYKNFVTLFDQANHGIISSLKQQHPDLNANDARFISYVYMNLSTKEISSLMNITPDACRKRKERISRKLGLENGSDLYSFLYSYSGSLE